MWSIEDADNWHTRNVHKFGQKPDRVTEFIKEIDLFPKRVFEVGCGNGWRLELLRDTFGCEAWGCDLSRMALADGQKKLPPFYNNLALTWREARNLTKIPSGYFDTVIYGFVLYACDPKDLFEIVKEGDRILADGGNLVIYDFAPKRPHSRTYAHNSNILTSKMQYKRLWLSSPVYSLVKQRVYAHEDGEEITEDTHVAVTVLKKDINKAFPVKS